MPALSARSTCEPFPAASVPLLQPPDSVVPDVSCADAAKGDGAGNDVSVSEVEVCPNESTFTNLTVAPTGTVVTAGLNPPLVPYAVVVTTDDVNETSIVTDAGAAAEPAPAGGAPGVQPANAEQRMSANSRTGASLRARVRAR